MLHANVGFSSALEDCLNAIGHGQTVGDCLALHPEYAETLRPYLESVVQMRQSSQSERQIPVDIPADIHFKVALNHSIRMIMRGKSPEYCYTQYPEHALELKPWLAAAVDVRENGTAGTIRELEFPRDLLDPQVTFVEALEYCLDALARGIQPEVALSRYPYYADRLRIWVYYITSLRLRLDLDLRPDLPQSQPTARTLSTRISSYSRPFYNVVLSILLTFFILSGVTGFAQAANESLPGDTLYPIKQTMRQVRIGLAPPVEQRYLIALIERERRFEVATLIGTNQERQVEFTGQVVAVDEDGVVIEDVGKVFINPGEKLPTLRTGVFVFVQGSTTRSGVSARNIDMVAPPGASIVPPTATKRVSPPIATDTEPPVSTATHWFSPTPTMRLFTPTWTISPIPQATETFTSLPTNTLTNTPTFTSIFTATFTNIPSPTFAATRTLTSTPSLTVTHTSTPVPSNTPTPIPTNTSTDTPTPPPTGTFTPRPTNTPTPQTSTDTPTPPPTETSTPRPTNTPTPLPTNTSTPLPIPSSTLTPDLEILP